MLVLTSISLATTEQLFSYKKEGFTLENFSFPGYTNDQWGIKAHNRPWIEAVGDFNANQKIIEVGGAYSLLPKYLANKYSLEGWIGDDYGEYLADELWSRWGDPKELPNKHPEIKYVFEAFGKYSDKYPAEYFDKIFSVSTLEHIPKEYRLDVFKDMNRCLRPGGMQLHTIDVSTTSLNKILLYSLTDTLPKFLVKINEKAMSEIRYWVDTIEKSGVKIEAKIPNSLSLLDRSLLVESPDVVYRFYPPNDDVKVYRPTASLLVVIEDV